MRSISIFFILFLTTASLILAQKGAGPNVLYNAFWPTDQPNYKYNGYLFYTNGVYAVYNLSNGEWWNFYEIVPECQEEFFITNQNEFFCYPMILGAPTESLVIKQFSPENFSIIGSYNVNISFMSLYYIQSGQYYTFLSQTKQFTANWSAITFNTQTKQFICNMTYTSQKPIYENDFTGNGFLYQSPNENQSIYYLPCNAQNSFETTTTARSGYEITYAGYNQSSVFLGSAMEMNFAQAAYIDLTGNIFLGPIYPLQSMQFNDTHFMAVFSENGMMQIGLYTITPNLNILLVSQFNSKLDASFWPGDENILNPLSGEECLVIVSLSTTSGFIYNFDTQEYVTSFPDIPPIILANGTTINSTALGYFVQNPGEPISFINVPFHTTYQDPNGNDIWTLYAPSSSSYKYPNCTLIHYQINTSTINQTIFPSCPNDQFLFGVIYDVVIDQNNNPIVIYAITDLFIIQVSGYNKVLSPSNTQALAQASLNFTSGIGSVVFTTDEVFEIAQFNISTGSLLNSKQIPLLKNEYSGTAVQKLSEQYYLLGTSLLTQTNYYIWDSVNQVSAFNLTTKATFIQVVRRGFQEVVIVYPIVGVNIDVNTPNKVGAMVTGYDGYFDIVSISGNVQQINLVNQTVENIVVGTNGSFWILSDSGLTFYWRNYIL